MAKVLFGYRHVADIPYCDCADPGNYLSLEQDGEDPLLCTFRCWCGSTMQVTFDSLEERKAFLAKNGVV